MPERLSLPSGPEAPAQARRAVAGWLVGTVPMRIIEDVTLLVSELVTNAVRHPRQKGPIELGLSIGGRQVRVEVSDPGQGFDKPRVGEPPPDAIGGRGLLIVDRVAARWGVTSGQPTRVWFEVDR